MNDENTGWRRVTTGDGGLSLLLPPGWAVEDGGSEAVLIASPCDGVNPVLVVTLERGFNGGAAEYRTANVIALHENPSMPGYADHGGGAFHEAGQEVAWHTYSYATDGGRLRVTIFCAVGAGGAYLVNCGAREAGFAAHRATVEAIGRSIRTTPFRDGSTSARTSSPER